MAKRVGRKSKAQTPAPPKERIFGSKKNPKGSASSEKSASKIRLNKEIIKGLENKLAKFKEENPNKKNVNLNDLKAVFRRGLGAYSSSHRPTISGGVPNTRNAWAFARVNKFLKKASGEKVKKAYVQDDDLLKMSDGGEVKIVENYKGKDYVGKLFIGDNKGYITFIINNDDKEIAKATLKKIKLIDALISPEDRILLNYKDESNINRTTISYLDKNKLKLDDYVWIIDSIQVHPSYRKMGYSRTLLNEIKNWANKKRIKELYLFARPYETEYESWKSHNSRSVLSQKKLEDFYRREGFEKMGGKNYIIKMAKGGLLAPNGKPSNLTPEQYKLVRTPQFKAWFGDWENDPENASKVVDENGEPLVVYHGTGGDLFYEFMPSAIEYVNGQPIREFRGSRSKEEFDEYIERYGLRKIKPNFWFSVKPVWGKAFLECFLRIKKIFHTDSIHIDISPEYDGFNVKNDDDNDYYCVFESNQIKLADGTNTTFDGSNPDIRFEEGGEVNEKEKYIDEYFKRLEFNRKKLPPKLLRYWTKMASREYEKEKLKQLPYRQFKVTFSIPAGAIYHETISARTFNEAKTEFRKRHGRDIQGNLDKIVSVKLIKDKNFANGGELNNINIPKSDYLRNIRAKVLSIYSENDAVEFRADFGDNGGITWEIPAHQVEKGLVNNPTYLIVQSMDRDKDNLSLVATKEGSKGEGAKAIASLFNIYPSLEEIGYDDYSQFDSGGSFWQKIGGSEDILTRENFFEYYKTKGYAKGGEVDRGQANYGEPNVTIDKIPLIHETINKYANSILKEGFKKSSNKNITLGVYTIPLVWKKSPFDNSSRSGTEIKVKLKKGSKIFWTNTNRPMDFYYGVGNKYFNSLFKKLGGKNDDSTRLKFLRNFEKWLDDNGYCGVQQGGEIVITNLSCIDIVEKYTRDKLAKGGEVDKKVLRQRWAKKKDALENLANNISRLRKNLSKDLKEGNEKEKLTALVVKIMDETGERVGNEESANNGHFGVTGLKKNHIKINGSRVKFKYVGKSGVEHEKELNDYTIASALKQAMSQSPSEYVFETSEGFRIKNDRVNRYLNIFNVSAKDLRGYSANKWIINKLKSVKDKEILNNDAKRKKKFNEIVKSVAEKVGHGSATLKKHYLLPSLEREFVNHGKIVDLSNIKRTYKHGGETDEVNTGVDVIHNIDADPLDELKDIPNDGEGVFARGGNIENRVKGRITIYPNGSAFVTLKSNYGYKNEVGYASIYYVTIKRYFNKAEQKKIIDALTKKGVNPNSKIRVIEFLEIYENYRGKGYASYLLKGIIEYYKEAGVKYLVLSVGQGSDAPEEGHGKKALSHKALFDFYSRHGFESILEGESYMIIDLQKVKFDKGGNINDKVTGEITRYPSGSALVTINSKYGKKNEIGFAEIEYMTIKKYFDKPEQKKLIDVLRKKGLKPTSKIRIIELLEIVENYRGKGYASYLLQGIIEYYKEAGDKYLVLGVGQGSDAPDEHWGKKALSHKALLDFYSRHGFEEILEGHKYMIIDLEKVKFDKGGKLLGKYAFVNDDFDGYKVARRLQSTNENEPANKLEKQLYKDLERWQQDSTNYNANKLYSNKNIFDKLATQYPKIFKPSEKFQYVYRGISNLEYKYVRDIIWQLYNDKIELSDFVKIDDVYFLYTKPFDYKPERNAQSWTKDIDVALSFSRDAMLITKKDDNFIMNYQYYNAINEVQEDELIHLGKEFDNNVYIMFRVQYFVEKFLDLPMDEKASNYLKKLKFAEGGKTQIKEANKELVEKTDTSLLLPTYTIEDVKTYVDDLNREDINDILDKLNMPFNVVDELGSGANGIAWQTNRGTVLKITKSGQEAYSSYIIFKNQENFSSQAEIYNLFVVIDLEDLEKYYFIEKQLLRPARDVMSDELLDLYRDIEMIATSRDSKEQKIDEFNQLINDEDINLDDIDKEYAEQIFDLAMKVKEEAKPYGLNLNDNHSGNVGFDWMGKLYCFDCGYVEKKSFLIGGNLNNKLMLTFKDGGEITQEDKKEIYAKWRKLVNMSRSEIERFYNSEEGKVAGLTPQEADEQGIDSGRESARWIMKMKSTKVADWTPMMWKWAKKQISFISRMSGNKGKLVDENGAKTRKHLSLLIWGHNPNKKGMGGDVEEPCHVCSMSEGGYNQLPSLTEMADGKRFIYREDVFRKGGDTNTHVGSRYMILECMGEGGITDTLNLKVIQSSDGLLPNTMITRPIRNIINRGREMGERFGKTIVGSYKKGGELNPDDKKVKNYFEHKSGEAGGLLVGKRHSEGGIKAINHSTGQPLEMEGGEVVITRDAVSDSTKHLFEGKYMTNRQILSAINVSGGGVSFAEGGETPELNC